MSKFLKLVATFAFLAAFLAPVWGVSPVLQGHTPSAFAHDTLISYSPSGTVHEDPKKIVMQFTGSPLPNGTFLIVTDHHNNKYAKGTPKLSGGTLTQELSPLTPGREYFVDWKITSTDGHPLGGTFSFFYAAAGAQKPSHADHDHTGHDHADRSHANHTHSSTEAHDHAGHNHADHSHADHDSHTKAHGNTSTDNTKDVKSADLSSNSVPIVISVIVLIIALVIFLFVFKIRMRRKEK